MATAYHMVHYRKFDTPGTKLDGKHLESLCRSALGVATAGGLSLWERAEDRLYDLADAEKRQIILNSVADLSGVIFGEIRLVQSGDLQALLELKASKVKLSNVTTAEIYKLGERQAPKGSQFIRGMAYWMAIGNHLLFVKTQSMTAPFIQSYLEWLLKVGTDTLPPDAVIDLQSDFDRSQVAGDIGDIRNMRVSGFAAPVTTIADTAENDGKVVQTSRKIADKFVQFGQAIPIVEALFGKAKADSLVESLGDQEYLAVDAAVKVRGKRTEKSRAKMREIAGSLDDMTDAKVQVEGVDGKLSDGDAILRTRMPFNRPYDGSNLLEFDKVADQLQEVYVRFVKDGKIKA